MSQIGLSLKNEPMRIIKVACIRSKIIKKLSNIPNEGKAFFEYLFSFYAKVFLNSSKFPYFCILQILEAFV